MAEAEWGSSSIGTGRNADLISGNPRRTIFTVVLLLISTFYAGGAIPVPYGWVVWF
jgi:hypothetical protein